MSTNEQLYADMLERLISIYQSKSYDPSHHAHIGEHFKVAHRCAQALYSIQSALENKHPDRWLLPLRVPIHLHSLTEIQPEFSLITSYNGEQLDIYTSPPSQSRIGLPVTSRLSNCLGETESGCQ